MKELTPEESAQEVLGKTVLRLGALQTKLTLSEREYWRRIFVAAAIQSGADYTSALNIADEILTAL